MKKQIPQAQLTSTVGPTLSFMFFDPDPTSPWKDPRVRQAVSMAINRDDLLELGYNLKKLKEAGLDVQGPWHNIIPAGETRWWIDPKGKDQGDSAKFFKYDPAEAKKLLSAAGYPDGFSTVYQYTANRYGKLFNDIAEAQINYLNQIGIKTTRLRSVNGELIVVGNSDLVNSRIRNWKRLNERRALFTIGVTYSTPHAALEAIPGILKEIIETTPNARFDRAHFKSFGDWALLFEAVYFCTKPEYNALMDVQQRINLEIKRRFEERGIEMAYPTQTVIHRDGAEGARLVPGRAPGR